MIEKTFSVEGSPDIDVRLKSGRLSVRKGETGKVRVAVDTDDPGFLVEQRGNSILVSSDMTSPWMSRSSSIVDIEAPEGSDLFAAGASARIECGIDLGKVELKTASGDIDMLSATNVTVKSASGDIRVESVREATRISSASGSISIRGKCSGSVSVSSASGDVHIETSDATLKVNTASGDVYVGRFTGRSAGFKSVSGDIAIGIPAGTSVSLDVNLLSGKLHTPKPQASKEPAERATSIAAKTVSGDLTIKRL